MRNWRAKQKAQAASQAPVVRRLVLNDWPKGDCRFRADWPDGFVLEVQVTKNIATLTSAEWTEEIAISPGGETFLCNGCDQPTPELHEGPDEFVCQKCKEAG